MIATRAANFAEEFGGDADITGDLVLGHALRDLRIFVEELQVTFLRRLRDGSIEALLENAQRALDEQAEHPFEGGDLFEEQGFAGVVDGKQFAVFDGFDKEVRGTAFGEAGQVAHPPIFDGEEKDRLRSFFVQVIGPDTAFQDKGLKIANFSFL